MRFGILIAAFCVGTIGGTAIADELASVNGKIITTEALARKLAGLPSDRKESLNTAEGRRELLDILIARELLYQEAVRHDLEKDEAIRLKMVEARRTVLIEAMVDRLTTEKVTPEALKTYYAAHRNDFREIRASHILVGDETQARTLKDQLNAGASFADMARKLSKDARTGPAGGDLGYFTKARMASGIAAAAFGMRVNQISDPVKTRHGYHLVMVTDIREAKRFEDLPPILDEVKRAVLQEAITAIRAAGKVTVNAERLRQLR